MGDGAAITVTMEGEGGSLLGRLSLPLRVRVTGIDAVLVAADAYDALFQASRRSVGARFRIERDPEVQRFVDERFATQELAAIRAEIVRAFGEERAPSLSGLHRYVMAQREAAGAVTRPTKGHRGSRGPR